MTYAHFIPFIATLVAGAVGIVSLFYIANLDKNQNNLSDQKVQNWLLTGAIASSCGFAFAAIHTVWFDLKFGLHLDSKWGQFHLFLQVIALVVIGLVVALFWYSRYSSNATLSNVKNWFQVALYVGIVGAILFVIATCVHHRKYKEIKAQQSTALINQQQ